jgi:hypothetical protein
LGSEELGLLELGSGELGLVELGSEELGLLELGSGELGSEELGSGELGPEELGPEELGSGELGPGELGSGELGPAVRALVAPGRTHWLSNPGTRGPGAIPGSGAAQDRHWLQESVDLGRTRLARPSPGIRKRLALTMLPGGCLRWMRCFELAFRC